jgi:hypothetical protein
MKRVSVLALVGVAAALMAAPQAQGAINYNASKSNTVRAAAHACRPGETRGCTAHRTHAKAYDPGSAQLTGRRAHHPLAAAHGAYSGKRRHQAVTVAKRP